MNQNAGGRLNRRSNKTGVLMVIFGTCLWLISGPTGAVDEPIPAPAPGIFAGQVASVDVKARLLKATDATATLTFQVAPDAKIVDKDNQPVPLGDLKAGEKITVNYTRDEPNLVAHNISLPDRTAKPPAIESQ